MLHPRIAGAFELFRFPNGTPSLISGVSVAAPVNVVLQVRTAVTPDDEAWIAGVIRTALDHWETVSTTAIRFTVTTVRSDTTPPPAPGQLNVTVANFSQLTSGGSFPPSAGNPGTWLGAAADDREVCGAGCSSMETIATHELGHAIGLMHTSIDDLLFPGAPIPIMYFAARSTGLTPDDVAAISLAYPDPAHPLGSVTGTLRGVCVAAVPPRTAATSGAEQACQRQVVVASGELADGEAACLASCDAARRSGKRRRCVASNYDATTRRCLARHERRTRRQIAARCSGSADSPCLKCLDDARSCDPDHGFGAWVAAGFDPPVSLERQRVERLAAGLLCGGTAAPHPEARCARKLLRVIVHASRAIRACVEACNERRQAGRLGSGANCLTDDPRLDAATADCLRPHVDAATSRMAGCPLPSCAAGVASALPRVLVEPAVRDARLLFCDAVSRMPLTGVNVVAVQTQSGVPTVARLSGGATVPGGFDVVGLPPGTYELHLLGGTSFRGSFPMLIPTAIQSDDFAPSVLGPFTVAAGDVLDLGDVPIAIDPVSADRVAQGNRYHYETFDLSGGRLPAATVGGEYGRWVHLHGGVRPLVLSGVSGLPSGMQASLVAPSGFSIDPYGESWIQLSGAPDVPGSGTVRFEVRDLTGQSVMLPLELLVDP